MIKAGVRSQNSGASKNSKQSAVGRKQGKYEWGNGGKRRLSD